MDLFASLSDVELESVRKRLINAIMWTDMAKHFDMVAKLDGKIQASNTSSSSNRWNSTAVTAAAAGATLAVLAEAATAGGEMIQDNNFLMPLDAFSPLHCCSYSCSCFCYCCCCCCCCCWIRGRWCSLRASCALCRSPISRDCCCTQPTSRTLYLTSICAGIGPSGRAMNSLIR